MEQDLQHSFLQMKGTNNGSFIRSFSFHPITLQNAQQHLARSTSSSLEAQKFPFPPDYCGGGGLRLWFGGNKRKPIVVKGQLLC